MLTRLPFHAGASFWGAGLVAAAGAVSVAWLTLGPQNPGGPISPSLSATDDDVIEALHAALDAWAKFAVTGDLDVLDGHFHPEGPQYEQLRAEAVTVHPAGDAGPPYRFKVRHTALRERSRQAATVMVDTTLSRDGEADRRYQWVFDLRQNPDHTWIVWTVSTVEGGRDLR